MAETEGGLGSEESYNCNDKKQLYLKKCASDFAQYCQVDVTEEVTVICFPGKVY